MVYGLIFLVPVSLFTDEQLLFEPLNPTADAIPVIYAFPNTYTVGITSLGYQVVWANLATNPLLAVSRLFMDGGESLPAQPELIGFSLSWELDYVNILTLLEQLQVPIHAIDRTNNHPLIFGGGPVLTANPEPFAEFFDVVLVGDGEELLGEFVRVYSEVRDLDRSQQLRRLAQVPGVYVPSLYVVTYAGDEIASIQPIDSDIPATITKQTYRGRQLSASTVVTPKAAWENIFMVEVVRSCPEMCRFCLASYLTLPFRTASLEESLIPEIDRGLQFTNRLGLLGASVTQHPQFEELIDRLALPKYDGVRLSISSVRTNTVTEKLAKVLTQRDSKSITIAVESGSARVREIVNKKLATPEIAAAAVNAKAGGLSSLKLYGMVGIPGEEIADVEASIEMMLGLKKTVPGLRLTWGCSTFVPKAHTPFQWYGVRKEAEKRLQLLQKQLKPRGIEFRPESYSWSVIQALISRGDRRLTRVLELTREYGDSLGSYKRAFKDLRGSLPSLEYYVHEDRSLDSVLPWSHILGALSTATIIQHHQISKEIAAKK
jgi:radical SAM superfamily enzyme YgiQ (UPF0313 family)